MGVAGQYDHLAVSASERLVTYGRRLVRFAVTMAAIIAVMAGSLALIGPQIKDLVSAHRSDHRRLSLKPLAERSYIYDASGRQLEVLTNSNDPQNRSQVPLADIPKTVTGSVIAVEDDAFFEHEGINVRSILRAVDANLESGAISQGGSTITQQVVKNSLVGSEQDLSRKLNEAFLAVELEEQMSKDEILEYYLNSVYFGGGAYGVQAAADYYFDKDVSDLDWAEGALLASLIRSPNEYNPFNNLTTSKKRRDLVFRRLVDTGRLSRDEVAFWEQVALPTTPNKPPVQNDYFVEEVKQRLLNDPKFNLGATETDRDRSVYEGGIRVYTTSDPVTQLKALAARNETLPGNRGDATFDAGVDPRNGKPLFGTEGIVSIEPSTGAVRAMVGGPDYKQNQFNVVTAERQPGSTMKTFVMATLFEQGHVPEDTVGGGCRFTFNDGDREGKPYKGSNGTILSMTQKSSNCGFMKLGQVAGLENVAELANKVGVKKAQLYAAGFEGNPTVLPESLPLGTREISPLEMASAYATFADDGRYNEPYYVERIEDRTGKVLYQHEAAPVQAVSVQTARLVTKVLEANVAGGTGQRAQLPNGQSAAGKTGTTDKSTDVWFVGYTPRLATAIWIGVVGSAVSLDSNPELRGATGGRFAAATWGRYYASLTKGRPNVDFAPPHPTRSGESVGPVPNLLGSRFRSRFRPRPRGNIRSQPRSIPAPTATPPSQPDPAGIRGGN